MINKISSIKSFLNCNNFIFNSTVYSQHYSELNSLYTEVIEKEMDGKNRFVIESSIYILYKYGFHFENFYRIENGNYENLEDLEKTIKNYIKNNFPEIELNDNKSLSENDVFTALEKINWNIGDNKHGYKNQQLMNLKNEIRPVFLFYFYKTEENVEKCFWNDLSNLLVNEFSIKNRKDIFGKPVEREYLKDYDFLEERFNKVECLKILELFNKRRYTLGQKNCIEEIDVLEKALKNFLNNELSLDFNNSNFKKLFNMLLPKLNNNAGLYALLFVSMKNFEYSDFENYFPPKNKKLWRSDARIYSEIEEEEQKNNNEKEDDLYIRQYKALIPENCIRHDVSLDLEKISDERNSLLINFFFFAIYEFIGTISLPLSNEKDDREEFIQIKKDFLVFCKNGKWKTEDCLKNVLNRLSRLCKIAKENPFSKIDFSSFNRSSYFKSNQALLLSFYNLSRFSENGKISTLNQLDFIDTYQQKLFPISRDYRPNENSSELKNLDCGYGDYLYQCMPFDGVYYPRPMKYKLWQDSDREFFDFEKLPKEKRKSKDKEIKRNINKNNLTCHYFYSIDRNMMTHFSIHKSIEIILQDSEKLILALEDIENYFTNLEEDIKNSKYFKFLRKKFDHIYAIIKSERSGNLTDEQGKLQSDFDLKEDFGIDFYEEVKDFFEIMYVSDENLFNEESFGLWIYMLYITFFLANKDAQKTENEIVSFNISDENYFNEKKFVKKDSDRNVVAYVAFFYQLRNILTSNNMKEWEALPISVITKLYNGDFESIPNYVRKMTGIMKEAKLYHQLKDYLKNKKDFPKLAQEEWKETAKDLNCYKDLYNFKFDDFYYLRNARYNEKIITVNGIKQKVYSSKYRNFKVELSSVLNEKTDEFEIYLGKKKSDSQEPVYSFTRFNPSFGNYSLYKENFEVLNHVEIDSVIEKVIDDFIRNFSNNYFANKDFSESENTVTLDELKNKIENYDKQRIRQVRDEIDKICNERKQQDDCSLYEKDLKILREKERFYVSVSSREDFLIVNYYNFLLSDFNFKLVLSEDKKSIKVFDYWKNQFYSDLPICEIPVSSYEILFDFGYDFLTAISSEENEINYDSDIPEMKEIKKEHFRYLKEQHEKKLKDIFTSNCQKIEDEIDWLEMKIKYDINYSWDWLRDDIRDLQNKIDEMEKNGEWTDIDGNKFIIEGYDFSFTFRNEGDFIWNRLKLAPTDDGSYLSLKVYMKSLDGEPLTFKLPSCQYRKVFKFVREWRDCWENNYDSYYIYEEKSSNTEFRQKVLNTKKIEEDFKKLTSKVFDDCYDSSVVFTPTELYRKMETEKISRKAPLCFAEQKTVNGIRQVVLSTGLEIQNLKFGLIPIRNASEIEVYFGEKTSESDKPIFKLGSENPGPRNLLQFVGNLVFNERDEIETFSNKE